MIRKDFEEDIGEAVRREWMKGIGNAEKRREEKETKEKVDEIKKGEIITVKDPGRFIKHFGKSNPNLIEPTNTIPIKYDVASAIIEAGVVTELYLLCDSNTPAVIAGGVGAVTSLPGIRLGARFLYGVHKLYNWMKEY